jgi:exodeoxyribonuclease V alpha subunit
MFIEGFSQMSQKVPTAPLDLANLARYTGEHFEHVFVPQTRIGERQVMMMPGPVEEGFPSTIRESMTRGMVMGHLNFKGDINTHQAYICLFRVTDRFDANNPWLRIDSMIPSRDFGVTHIVEKTMQSWRFGFLKEKRKLWYDNYGEYSFMMLDHDEAAVKNLLGLNDHAFMRLKNEWGNLRDTWHEIRMLLRHNIDMRHVDLLVDAYRENKDSTMDRHPFRVLRNITLNSDVETNYFRATGVLDRVHVDMENVIADYLDATLGRNGHTAVNFHKAINDTTSALKVKRALVETKFLEMIKGGRADFQHIAGEDSISLGKLLRNDQSLARELSIRSGFHSPGIMHERYSGGIRPDGKPITLSDEQNTAIFSSLIHRTSLITGGPGTGKSTTANALVMQLRHLHPNGRILLSAPTGKAAKRLSELTRLPCQTMHRLLGMAPNTASMLTGFGEHDTLIVDETTMCDQTLLANACRHMKNRGRLILMGDKDQLESVDAGAVFRDVIQSRHFPVAELSEVRRQGEGSLIVSGAYAILEGKMPEFRAQGGDLHFVNANSPAEIAQKTRELVESLIPKGYGIERDDIQILASMRKGQAGINELNRLLKPVFNPQAASNKAWGRMLGNNFYHVGDRVMQLKNRYDKDIQNGETGIILDFNERKQEIVLGLDDREVCLPYSNYLDMTHSWASTVHKSQGSEYPCVIFVLPDDHLSMLTKRLIFTAMTRGKQHVFFVGNPKTLQKALESTWEMERQTHLSFFMAEQHTNSLSSERFKQLVTEMPRHRPKASSRVSAADIEVPF